MPDPKTLKRYRLDEEYDEEYFEMMPKMVEDPEGEYVRAEDVARILSEVVDLAVFGLDA